MNQFQVDAAEKEKQRRAGLKYNPVGRPIRIIVDVMWIAIPIWAVALTLVTMTTHSIFVPGFIAPLHDAGGNPDWGGIFMNTTPIALLLLFILFAKVFNANISGGYNQERKDETLAFDNGVLEYGFFNWQMYAFPTHRVIVRLDLSRLQRITYHAKSGLLEFFGEYSAVCYKEVKNHPDDTADLMNDRKFLFRYGNFSAVRKGRLKQKDGSIRTVPCFWLHDYFTPGLTEFLKQNKVQIEYLKA